MSGRIQQQLSEFVVENYLFGDASRLPKQDDPLVEHGVIDSTGILELVEYLESEFGIEVLMEETIPENLGSIGRITRFVERKVEVC